MATRSFSFPPKDSFEWKRMFRQHLFHAWMAVLCGLIVIRVESTPLMAGQNTARWLGDIWPTVLGKVNTPFFAETHHLLRKTGHFTGYGTLSVLFCRAWYSSIRAWLHMIGGALAASASALGVAFTFLCASLDELHQSTIPGRVSTPMDVLLDTCGATMFTLAFWALRSQKGQELMGRLRMSVRPQAS